jgi:hypothetical protein
LLHKKKDNKQENNTITLLIMGHGRERYKENFQKMIETYTDYYSDPFIQKVKEQKMNNSVRILSKAGKPKICAWDYKLCTSSMSSQDVILKLSYLFFSEENEKIDTFNLMNSLSVYFKKLYPEIIGRVAKNYRDLPEDKNPGSPDAYDYSERYEHFNKVLESLKENKFSDLKALNHQKIFTIRPDNEDEYKHPCEKYLFEIVEYRTQEVNELTNFIKNYMKVRENLTKDYFSMTKEEMKSYINNYSATIYEIYSLGIHDYEKYYLLNFVFKLYFGNEIMLSEIVEFFQILGIQTINIIDNTCRVQEKSGAESSTSVKTSEIEFQEQIKNTKTKTQSHTKTHTKTQSSPHKKSSSSKTRKKTNT